MTGAAVRRFAFFVPLVALWGWAEWSLSNAPSFYAEKRIRIERNLGTAEILILGTSHGLFAINPNLMKRPAVNFAFPGQTFEYDARFLDRYASRMPRLKRLIWNVSFYEPAYSAESKKKSQLRFYYSRFFGLGLESFWDRLDLRRWSLIALYGNRKVLEEMRSGFKGLPAARMDERGWHLFPREGTKRISLSSAKERLDFHLSLMDESRYEENLSFVEKAVRTLRARNVQTVLVETPAYKTYYGQLPAGRYGRFQREMRALSRRLGVPYLEYLRDGRFAIGDFANNDHLNDAGAAKFTAILERDISPNPAV